MRPHRPTFLQTAWPVIGVIALVSLIFPAYLLLSDMPWMPGATPSYADNTLFMTRHYNGTSSEFSGIITKPSECHTVRMTQRHKRAAFVVTFLFEKAGSCNAVPAAERFTLSVDERLTVPLLAFVDGRSVPVAFVNNPYAGL